MKEKSVLHTQFLKDSSSDANCGKLDESSKSGSVCVGESAKRARMVSLQAQIPVCIVHGCNKDLSSSKEYYKKHKVCEVHSKTAVVIVHGVRQRLCQQCSRFHILAEFDNGKRSCRRRLAGHNERRRKPQLETHFDYGTDICRASLFFSTYLHCTEPIRHTNELLKFGSSPPPPLLHLNEMELSAMSNSSCAPSLLSAPSESSFRQPATIHHLSFNSSTGAESDQGVHLCGSTPSDELVLHEPPSVVGANTVDLLQLSLHLQRVEHQKQSEQAFIYSHHEHLMY